ncbi:hypothetical protein Ancab_013416 [Ancistrocladus abbreviatus]
MATHAPINIFIFSVILFFHHSTTVISAATTTTSPHTFVLPVVKDIVKVQYYTSFLVGTPPVRVYTVLDLGNKYSWIACDIYGYNVSSTFHPILCGTPKCSAYGENGCVGCIMPVVKPSCTKNTCGAYAYTPWGDIVYSGGQIEDTISLYSRTPSTPFSKTSLRNFPFTCADSGPLKGLSQHTKGVLTLARNRVALHSQIASAFKVPHKFALCFPSSSSASHGAMYFGGGPYYLPPSRIDLTKYLVTTPLIINPNSTAPVYSEGERSIEYFVKVRSIKVDGIPVTFKPSLLSFDKDGKGGTKLSTLTSYTTLHSEIYKALVGVFFSRAEAMKITRVASVAPFGACFSSKSISYNAKTGAGVPIIDLVMVNKSPVLHGKNARWRIYGANSMVKVSPEVSCLGFVNGGSNVRTAIVIGGQQMEDNLIEFNLASSQLGFTSSLLHFGTSCSQFRGL